MKKYDHLLPTIKEALKKGASFCAYRERSQEEVRKKLLEIKYDSETVEEVIYHLIREGFIDEVRYAKAYAGGKFRNNKWGRTKIIQHLKKQQLSDYCIKKGMEEIDDAEYRSVLDALLAGKRKTLKDTNPLVRKKKLLDYALSKGYEYALILENLQ